MHPEPELVGRPPPAAAAEIFHIIISSSRVTNESSARRFLIWIGSDQERTFGPTITGLIHKHIEPERMILWDSKKQGGRPDTMKLLKETWESFGAEVIFITSNKLGNDEMMQGCRAGTLALLPPIPPLLFRRLHTQSGSYD